jgi:hypothetical protein
MDELRRVLNEKINEKYSIPVSEYWSLPESNKDDITNSVVSNMFISLQQDARLLHQYIFMLDTQMENALELELFEHADIVKRIKNKLIENYSTI